MIRFIYIINIIDLKIYNKICQKRKILRKKICRKLIRKIFSWTLKLSFNLKFFRMLLHLFFNWYIGLNKFTTLCYFTDILQGLIDIVEKLDSHIFEAITQLRSNKKQPNESTIMTYLSEKLEELNIDKSDWQKV